MTGSQIIELHQFPLGVELHQVEGVVDAFPGTVCNYNIIELVVDFKESYTVIQRLKMLVFPLTVFNLLFVTIILGEVFWKHIRVGVGAVIGTQFTIHPVTRLDEGAQVLQHGVIVLIPHADQFELLVDMWIFPIF